MKKITILTALFLYTALSLMAQIGLNSDSTEPDISAMLDVKSKNAGFLPPRMTTSQRNSIPSPALGLVIYNATTECLEFFEISGWIQLCGSNGTPANNGDYLIGSNGSCINTAIAGSYIFGIPLDGSNTVIIAAVVITVGDYVITTDTINGYSFSATGTFASTGTQQITLVGSGTPIDVQLDNFTATANAGGGTCTYNIKISYVPTYCTGSATVVQNVLNPGTGETWMDRNLGAIQVADSSTDVNAYGDLYQWGRFTDGHQCRTSSTITTLATTAVPNLGNPWDGLYVVPTDIADDWLNITSSNTDLWVNLGGINTPCPNGYRLPTKTEFDDEYATWDSPGKHGAYDSPLKLTAGGFRFSFDGGFWGSIDLVGYYWSSTNYSNGNSYVINFNIDEVNTSSQANGHGFSVRCIKD